MIGDKDERHMSLLSARTNRENSTEDVRRRRRRRRRQYDDDVGGNGRASRYAKNEINERNECVHTIYKYYNMAFGVYM